MTDATPRTSPPPDAVRALDFALAAVMVVAALLATTLPGGPWWVAFGAPPAPRVVPWFAAYVVVAAVSARLAPVAARLALAGIFGGLVHALRAIPLGDRSSWFRLHESGEALLSEPIASVVRIVLGERYGFEAQRLVAPFCGVAAAYAWFRAAAAARGAAGGRAPGLGVAAAVWVASPAPLLFAFDYIENTQFAIPMLLGALPALARLGGGGPRPRRDATIAGIWLGVAGACHGVAWFCAPATLCAALWRRDDAGRRLRTRALDGVVGLAATAAAAALVLGALRLAGFEFHRGNTHGGADGFRFVRIEETALDENRRFGMFDFAHFREVASIFVLAAPAAVFGAASHLRRAANPGLLFPAGAFVAFAFLWNFDLGFPADVDLMAALGVFPSFLFAARTAAAWDEGGVRRKAGLAAVLVVAFIVATLQTGGLTYDRRTLQGQANGPAASLTIDGVGDGGGRGPFVVELDAKGPRCRASLKGPPFGNAVVIFGPWNEEPVKMPGGWGVLHVGRGITSRDSVEPGVRHLSFQLDAEGRFDYEWVGDPCPPGPICGVQALIERPAAAGGGAVLTAAFRCVAK